MTAEAIASAGVRRSSLALIAASYRMPREPGPGSQKAINAGADRGRKEAG